MNDTLMQKLNYHFKDAGLLTSALTHRSCGGDHNERLEFLGDSVVNFITAELLYHHFPKAAEGELSRWRASLVNRDALADMAKKFDLGEYLLLGPGEVRSGGKMRNSILSCAMEAVIGAIYLDAGFETVKQRIAEWCDAEINSLSSASQHKDPKTLLQEYLQSHKQALPIYAVESIEGEAHQQTFVVSCSIESAAEKTLGRGTSRRRAEQDAAQAMLQEIKNDN